MTFPHFYDIFGGCDTYSNDIYHWARSSSAFSACTVEPGTAEDVGKIVRVVMSLHFIQTHDVWASYKF